MFESLRRLFGGRPPRENQIPDGTRDLVEFAWRDPAEEGQPAEADLQTLCACLRAEGWPEIEIIELGFAANLTGATEDVVMSMEVGHDGDGPWVAFVELLAHEAQPGATAWVLAVHRALVAAGATNLRWYELPRHSRGDTTDPWSQPTRP